MTLSSFCPRRHELRDELPHGSLDSLARPWGTLRGARARLRALAISRVTRVGSAELGSFMDQSWRV